MVGIYITTVLVSYVLASLAEQNGGEKVDVCFRRMNIFVYCLIAFYILVLGFRYLNYSYSDEWLYRNTHVDELFSIKSVFRFEGLGALLVWISDTYFVQFGGAFANGQFYILSTSVIVAVLFVKAMWNYSDDFTFSNFLFVTMWFAFTSMNIIRQFVAVAIVFYAIKYIKKGELVRYCVSVLIAAGFHTSAIIMIPMYFFHRREKISSLWLLIIAGAFLMIGNIGSLGVVLGDSQYSHYFTLDTYGVKIIRLLTIIIPGVLLLIKKNLFFTEKHYFVVELNMLLITLIVCIFSTQNVYYNRISFYFSVVCLLLFPEIPKLFGGEMERIIKICMLALFFTFGLYQAMTSAPYYNILFQDISTMNIW